MLLTAIWNILNKHEPYSSEGYRQDYPAYEQKILTKFQALKLLKHRGFIIQDDPLVFVYPIPVFPMLYGLLDMLFLSILFQTWYFSH